MMRTAQILKAHYKQGQYVGKIREYFYYINHEGYLFLEDSRMKNFTSAYKDIDFLNFFYKNLRMNDKDRYQEEFPFISLCGRERNYLKCDDRPIVYTELEGNRLRIGQSGHFHEFKPSELFMKSNGRLYHVAPFADYALIKDKLADEFYPRFVFNDSGQPISFNWENKIIQLRLNNQ